MTEERQYPASGSGAPGSDGSCTREDLLACFRLLLGREPGQIEWGWHAGKVGMRRSDVVAEFLGSPEFKSRKLGATRLDEFAWVDLDAYGMYVTTADTAIGRCIAETRAYEPHVSRAIASALRPGAFFVDVGANMGFFSLLSARAVGAEGRVFAFEPFQQNVKLLFMSTRRNGFENIRIIPAAATDREALYFYDNMGSNGQIRDVSDDPELVLSSTLVPSTTLDLALGKLTRLDVIKIDVEGAEYLALTGGRDLLQRFRPTIFSELSPGSLESVSKVSASQYLEMLTTEFRYGIDVLHEDGRVSPCQGDVSRVLELFAEAGSDHIDIVARPVAF